jgi:hypothetical protein
MKKLSFTSIIMLLTHFYSTAQNFETALNKMAAQHSPEKIYIHYDKEFYVAGETIWFKAYFYNDGKPSAEANNLYLQFTDSKGHIVSNKMFPVSGAVARGNIDIPDSLPQGNYYIRALTAEMLNYEEAFIYKKNIFIFHPSASAVKEKLPAQNVSLQFFPESGNLIDGILTVVGFKAADQWGVPVDINGVIRMEDGTTIASFKCFHDGIGKVQFKAQAGKKYIAEVETTAGKRTYQLPEVRTSGINLKIQDEKGGKKFQLSRSDKDKGLYETVTLVAQINNHLVYENDISFEEYPSVIGHIVTDSLPSGILHFTVFNKDRIPVAERLSFVDNQEYVSNAEIVSNNITTVKRAENKIDLNFAELIQRSCSVSITDASGSSFNDNDNIWSRLLLTSDLKGYIYNPAWYFTSHSDTTKLAIDNLLLTHGWSRFNWTKIMTQEFPEKKYIDKPLLSITGRVMDEKNKEPLLNGKLNIFLEAEDSSSQNYEVIVDAAGKFKIDSLLFYGKGKFFYAYTDNKGKPKPALVNIDDNSLLSSVEIIPVNMLENNTAINITAFAGSDVKKREDYVKSHFNEIKELEKVTLRAKSTKTPFDEVNDKYTSGVFRSPGKVNIDNINEPANDKSLNVVDYIKNSIQQIAINGGRFVNRKNFSLISGQNWTVGVFLNESPTELSLLRTLRVQDIALIKFYEAGFVGVGSGSPGGAVAVYTKEKLREDEKPDELGHFEYNGYSITKQFYNPDYSAADAKHSLPDNRTTLYWNPDLFTDTETKSLKLNFFNNDFSTRFKIVVEGFDAAGKLIHLEKIVGN